MQRIVGHPVNVESFAQLDRAPEDQEHPARRAATACCSFALAVLIVGGVLIGQALARAVSAGAADLPTWRAIGADRGIAVRALVLPATAHARRSASVVGVAVAIGLSPRFPISQARRYDLDVGYPRRLAGARSRRRSRSLVAVLAIAIVSALWAVDRPPRSRRSRRRPSGGGRRKPGFRPRSRSARASRSSRAAAGARFRCAPR